MADRLPWNRVAVLAPHADDEVLGCGGTLARLADQGADTAVIIVTSGTEPRFSRDYVAGVKAETAAAHAFLQVGRTIHLDLPAAALETVPQGRLNEAVGAALTDFAPDTLLVPFVGDIHVDHQLVFNAALVWARPRSHAAPTKILAYETLSETNWWAPGITPAFAPNCYVDIADQLERKLQAFGMFRSQVKSFPDERSLETIRALARVRGSTVYRDAAEAFAVVRLIL